MTLPHLNTYYRVWLITAQNSLQRAFINRGTNALFFLGKLIRLSMSLLLLWLFKQQQLSLAGYSPDEVVVFFLTYQLIDVIAQVLYRGVYNFRSLIANGEFDFLLTKPINPLFRALTGEADINDAVFLIPTLLITGYLFSTLSLSITWWSILAYIVLLFNSFLIATALHILVLTLGVVTVEVDSAIFLYRDLMRLGQWPATIYLQPLRSFLFLVIPVGVMVTIPAQALLNQPLTFNLFWTTLIGVGFLGVSLAIWQWGLKHYSSTGS